MDGHQHELHPHSHGNAASGQQWCSARFWCADCRTWVSGLPCKGMSAAIPSLPGMRKARR
jgi:hypothetical protein